MPVLPEERRVIDDLFGKLAEVERRGPPRDPEAERLIADYVARQPGAPYYMAQTIVAQEHALEHAQRRIAELEAQASRQQSGGGFLAGIFGGGGQSRAPAQPAALPGRGGPWGGQQQRQGYGQAPGYGGFGGMGRGGGFLAGAAQTAVGVAGGVILGNMIVDAFTTDASEIAAGAADSVAGAAEGAAEDFGGDLGGGAEDFGGDFGEF